MTVRVSRRQKIDFLFNGSMTPTEKMNESAAIGGLRLLEKLLQRMTVKQKVVLEMMPYCHELVTVR